MVALAMAQKGRRHEPNRSPSARAQEDADEDTPGRAAVVRLGGFFFHHAARHHDPRAG